MTQIPLRTPAEIGALIRDRRRRLKFDQAELAQRIGVSRLWINQIERGKPGASLGLVLRALDAVGVRLMSDTPDQAQAVASPATPVITADIDAIVAEARGERRQ